MAKRLGSTGLCVLLGMSIGCGSTSALSTGNGGNALAFGQGADEPPHVFTARQHPPRQRAKGGTIKLASMPAMIERSSSCFDSPEPEKIATAPKRRSKGGSKKKSGFVPFSPSPTTPTVASATGSGRSGTKS